jgi:hypothetical protein
MAEESGKQAAAQKVTSAREINATENLLPPAQSKKSLLPTHFNLSRLNLNFEKDKQGQVAEDENAKPLQNAIRSESSAGAEGVGKRSQLTMKPGKLKLHKKVGGTTVPIPGSERPLDATPTDSKLIKARPGNELADQTSPLGLTLKEMEKQSDQDLLEILNGSDLKKITSVRGIGVTRAQRILGEHSLDLMGLFNIAQSIARKTDLLMASTISISWASATKFYRISARTFFSSRYR